VSDLTQDELKWVRSVQRALNKCPSKRIGFYTIGDASVSLYDKDALAESGEDEDSRDFCKNVAAADAGFYLPLHFPSDVASTAG